jgi:hypothetical protein
MMGSNPKLDLHPDAESLNAFAEQALGERERGRIVAHLAECGRCREVVYLAREAAGEMEPELAVAVAAAGRVTDSFERKEPHFWNRRTAWVAAGALAVAVTAAYVAHVRQVEVATEQAKAAREAAARTEEMAAAPETAQMEMKATALQAVPAPTAAKKGKSEATSHELQPMTAEAAPPPLVAGAMAKSSSDERALARKVGDGFSNDERRGRDVDRSGQLLQENHSRKSVWGHLKFRARRLELLHRQTRRSRWCIRRRGDCMRQRHAQHRWTLIEISLVLGPAGGKWVAEFLPMAGREPAALPSGLPAVSTASARGLTVTVDGAGALFVREDAGSGWESVTKQWSGRAVAVRLQVSAAGAIASSSAGAVFEIVNDQGKVWVSADGRNWKSK